MCWGQVPDAISDNEFSRWHREIPESLPRTMLPQTVVPRGTKGQGIVLWSSGRKPLLFDAIRVNTTIRFLKGTGENPNPLGLGVCQKTRSNTLFDTFEEFIPLRFEADSWIKAKRLATDHVRNNIHKIRSPLHHCNDAVRVLAYTPKWTKMNDTRFIKSNMRAGVTI